MSVAPTLAALTTDLPHNKPNEASITKKKARKWWTVRRKHQRRGVIEITEDHERHDVINLIRHGLRQALTSLSDQGPKEQLHQSDFTHVDTQVLDHNNTVFEFTSYASQVFRTLRQALGLVEEEYISAISPDRAPYLEFISNSKSGQAFYISNNQAYFMKTEKKKFVDYFRKILIEYLQYFLRYPHSLIVKYLGLYSIKVPGEKRKYFFVMQSIFAPHERIERRYDLKGCLINRYQKPSPEGSHVVTVYKDQNFVNEMIQIGGQREWMLEQLHNDVSFLRGLGVMDYSLLVGYHDLQEDERNQHLGDIVQRVKKSLANPVKESLVQRSLASAANDHVQHPNEDPSDQLSVTEADHISRMQTTNARLSVIVDGPLSFVEADNERPNVTSSLQSRRLLIISKNPLHIIDGEEKRYYIGIVDFFMKYGLKQRVERILKTMLRCGCDHSTQHPEVYADRFLRSISHHIE